ncbi:hypothetical protein EN817_28100 [Mesorhizobium sp. M3A.F.Ca.ET.174.01.1.1]|nr:hypothetical protein EN844_00625 [Mesorhizobium sp. M3A.F.Ca.ET.201.01.1.1]TGS82402.1 hypothetical protein EN818_27550 [Mesorhizobium sp. M3A.F.Ca.ET.175.01.1.1]TGT22224.1 hypothetical protein EN817_28100 [Mesorhizobium sp. M3A.F.Ca.ET.174.01.1.1]
MRASRSSNMFGLLRQVLPSRQVEMVEAVIALERVKLNTARVFVVLTPQSQLTNLDPEEAVRRHRSRAVFRYGSRVRRVEQGIPECRRAQWRLQPRAWAARGYVNRLMDSARVVRYLAHDSRANLGAFRCCWRRHAADRSAPSNRTGACGLSSR